MTLDEKLARIREGAKSRFPAPVHEVMAKATADLLASGQAARAVKVGDGMPAFALSAHSGCGYTWKYMIATTQMKRDRKAWLRGAAAQCEPPPQRQGIPRRLVLLGAPGVGKGTQAELLCANLGACHLSTGDIFRAAKALDPCQRTPALTAAVEFMRRGELVPDETVLALVAERVGCLRCDGGFLLDGLPRTVAQAEALEKLLTGQQLKLDAVISYEMPIDNIVSRLSGRRTCAACKAVFHVDAKTDERWLTAYRYIAKNFPDLSYSDFRVIVGRFKQSRGYSFYVEASDSPTLQSIGERSALFEFVVDAKAALLQMTMRDLRSLCQRKGITPARSLADTADRIIEKCGDVTLTFVDNHHKARCSLVIKAQELASGEDILRLDAHLRAISKVIRDDLIGFVMARRHTTWLSEE